MSPVALVRTLLFLKRHGWFDGLSGLLIGRSAGPVPQEPNALSYTEALKSCLGDLNYPILPDVDIGHQPPQFTLITTEPESQVQMNASSNSHFENSTGVGWDL